MTGKSIEKSSLQTVLRGPRRIHSALSERFDFFSSIHVFRNIERSGYLRPLPILVVFLILGILFGIDFPGYWQVSLLLTAVCMVHITVCVVRLRSAVVSPFVLFFAIGVLSVQPWGQVRFPVNHVVHYTDGGKARVTGIVAEPSWYSGRRIRFLVDVEKLRTAGKTIESQGRIRVTAPAATLEPQVGDRVVFTGRLRSFRNFGNPGGFDYKTYMRLKGIHASATAGSGSLKIVAKAESADGLFRFARFRQELSNRIAGATGPKAAPVLKALILGDRSGISRELRDAFNRAGIGHLLAISGLHVGIVASGFFFLFRFLAVRSRRLLAGGYTRKAAALLTFVPVIGYGLLSGMAPSTQRAVIMVSAFLFAILMEREHDPLSALALAALVILLLDPPAVTSISFQLSFAAVISIFTGLSVLPTDSNPSGAIGGRLWRWCRQFFWISLFAILGTLPLTMVYFHQTSLVGLAANFIFVPSMGIVAVPAGLTTAAIMVVFPGPGQALMGVLGQYMDGCLKVVEAVAGWPFAAVQTVIPGPLEVVCYYAAGWAILVLPGRKRRADTGETRGLFSKENHKQKRLAIGVLIIASVVMTADVGYWGWQRFLRKNLQLTALDVGQGTCILAELPGGKTMLVDGGGFSDNTIFDIGEAVVAPFLLRRKIRSVDRVVLSHPNSDHLNGLLYILDNFRIGEVWSNGEAVDTYGYRRFLEIIDKRNIAHRWMNAGSPLFSINGVDAAVLHPGPGLSNRSLKADKGGNDHSIVLRIEFGNISFLLPGDIMAKAEEELTGHSGIPATTVLFAPHHGSRSSSSKPFLAAVKPDWAVFTVGYQNRFNFPHDEIVARYRSLDISICRTDLDGAVTFSTDGENLFVQRFRVD